MRKSSLAILVLVLGMLLGSAFASEIGHAGDKSSTINGARSATAGGLKVGEYACFGSGGTILIGLGFKVLAGNRYTDLDGKNAGKFRVDGETVTFTGGHLDGQIGKGLKDYKFTIDSASCEPSN
jgi:hypothetical protein